MVSRASQVIGGKVTNANKEDLGKVEEIVINPSNGQIQYAVISFGGIMGMGDKFFAVPWSLLKGADVPEGRKDQTFVLNIDKAKLEKAPGFPKSNWPDIYAPEWGTEIDKYYGTTRAPDAGAAVEGNRQFQIFKVSELKGKKVKNMTGDELGDVKDIVIDPRSGRITYFVLTSGGFLGMNNKLFAIPWEALKVNKSEKGKEEVVLNVPKEKFEKAPEFKDEDWNRMSDPVWIKEMYTYYGVRPYWPATTDAGFEKPMPPGGANERGEEHQ
jgi:sporulation protein YlmC with PRC-barrel domain